MQTIHWMYATAQIYHSKNVLPRKAESEACPWPCVMPLCISRKKVSAWKTQSWWAASCWPSNPCTPSSVQSCHFEHRQRDSTDVLPDSRSSRTLWDFMHFLQFSWLIFPGGLGGGCRASCEWTQHRTQESLTMWCQDLCFQHTSPTPLVLDWLPGDVY